MNTTSERLQSAVFDPTTSPQVRKFLYYLIVGQGGSSRDPHAAPSSPPAIAVGFLKKLLDNQLGPEDERIQVLDSEITIASTGTAKGMGMGTGEGIVRFGASGRVATTFHIFQELIKRLQGHKSQQQLNGSAEDVGPQLREMLAKIVDIVDSSAPKPGQEWFGFSQSTEIMQARKLLKESEAVAE